MSHLAVLIAREQALEDAADAAGHEGERQWHARRVDALVDLRDLLASGRWPSSIATK